MPKRPASGQGWPVAGPATSEKRRGPIHRASAFRDGSAPPSGRRFLVTSFRCRKEVTRRQAKNFVQESGGFSTRASARCKVSKSKLDSRLRGNDEIERSALG